MDTTQPSKVLHARNLAPTTEANDLRQFASAFGQVAYVVMLPKYKQALIEMADVSQATSALQFSRSTPITIRGAEVCFNYSKSQDIKRSDGQSSTNPLGDSTQDHHGERILLLTIVNPLYPIDVSVLNSIMAPYGKVQRIVIFHKNGTQALVEFESPESAVRAKMTLDGKDIYDGCCTLKISYSRVERLNVKFNTDKTIDFTNPSLPTQAPVDQQYHAMLPSLYQQPMYPGMATAVQMPGMVGAQQGVPGSVLMVYNLPTENLTCDKVFNLFCLYGNVSRVKLLSAKPGSAMVQMFDKMQSDQAINNLNKLTLDGKELAITYSKHAYIADSRTTVDGAAATDTSCKDFSTSPSNRFLRQNIMSYKHIYQPTSVLFFSNVAPTSTEQTLKDFFVSIHSPLPARMKFFQNNTPKQSGLLEFASVDAAAMAVFCANNQRIEGHTLKLAFSANSLN